MPINKTTINTMAHRPDRAENRKGIGMQKTLLASEFENRNELSLTSNLPGHGRERLEPAHALRLKKKGIEKVKKILAITNDNDYHLIEGCD